MNLTAEVYTDGSSLNNPGPSGWGAILMSPQRVIELGAKWETDATNNQMELYAVIAALDQLAQLSVVDYEITIYADSKYVVDGITKWIDGWKARDWKKADKKPVLNQDLWKRLDEIKQFVETDNKIFFEHVKAHAGHAFNERVDDIAREHAEGEAVELYDGDREGYLLE